MLPNVPETEDSQLVRGFITRALAEFETNSAVPSILRGIASKAPDIFIQEAFLHLQSGLESSAHRHLATLLLGNPSAIALVANPTFLRLDQAITVAKRLMEVDSLFDAKLARKSHGRDSAGGGLPEAVAERVLDILNEISRDTRIVPILEHLTEHPTSRIAAKATLVIGRRIPNSSWLGRQLRNPDYRIRANAVEALWGVDSPSAREALNFIVIDPHNRVVGNAVFGLHLLKAGEVSQYIDTMLKNPAPSFRWTAAWVMGKTEKPEFVDRLHRMMLDDTPGVRRAALRALFHIKKVSKAPTDVVAESQKLKTGQAEAPPPCLTPQTEGPALATA